MSRVWFVTGSSTGLGRELCEELLRQGQTVVATARKVEAVRDLESGDCLAAELDVTKPDTIRAAVAATLARFGRAGGLTVRRVPRLFDGTRQKQSVANQVARRTAVIFRR